jgi:FNIP Repeat
MRNVENAHITYFDNLLRCPAQIKGITIDNSWTKSTETPNIQIPCNITSLEIHKCLVPITLPQNLQELVIGRVSCSICSLESLPPTLHTLSSTIWYDKVPVLPQKLKHLSICLRLAVKEIVLPPKLETLSISLEGPIEITLPASLTRLAIPNYPIPYTELPPKLTSLNLGNKFTTSISHLPPYLSSLTLGNSFNQPLNSLPHSITSLIIGDSFNTQLKSLPPTLKRLKIGDRFNQELGGLPSSLTFISIGNCFNQPVDCLPHFLATLKLGNSFNMPVDNLPPFLVRLVLGVHLTST